MGLDGIVKKTQEVVSGAARTVKDKTPGIVDGVKRYFGEVKKIATGDGSLTEKAKAAVRAVKGPGGSK